MMNSLSAWRHAVLEVSLFIFVSLTDQVRFAEKKNIIFLHSTIGLDWDHSFVYGMRRNTYCIAINP
jgi:hypothetical protein